MSRPSRALRYTKMSLEDRARLARRILSKMEPAPDSECITWMGALDSRGYGNVYAPEFVRGCTTKVHRVVIWLFRGIPPAGRQVHHTCQFRNCVNPYHLEVITAKDHSAWHYEEYLRRKEEWSA